LSGLPIVQKLRKEGMDSVSYIKKILDRIYRILWIFIFFFPDERNQCQSASRKEYFANRTFFSLNDIEKNNSIQFFEIDMAHCPPPGGCYFHGFFRKPLKILFIL